MEKKEYGFILSVVVFVVLITIKIWIKMSFELQLLGLVLLVALSWTLKFFIFKKIKK